MNKYILTGDMPKSCSECEYRSLSLDYGEEEEMIWCDILHTPVDNCNTKRHPQCPLQDTTELLEELETIKIVTKNKDKIKAYYKLYKALGGESK